MALHPLCAAPCCIVCPCHLRFPCNVASLDNRLACQSQRMDRREQLSWRSVRLSPAWGCTSRLSSVHFCGAGKGLRIYARKWWQKREDSKLSEDSPLPLSMAYPSPEPLSKKALDKLKSCDAQKEDCKPVIYQWTGKCKSCQGTGLVTFRRKKGRDVISKCIACIGLGYVQKITQRDDIKVMDEADPE